jgi:Rod binding domain-containing protein
MIRGLNGAGFDRVFRDAAAAPRLTDKQVKLREVASQFESYFLNSLMKTMRASVPKNPYFSGGFAEDVFTQMLDSAMTEKAAARSQGGSISEAIIRKYDTYASRARQNGMK